jgi:hypothetical protein
VAKYRLIHSLKKPPYICQGKRTQTHTLSWRPFNSKTTLLRCKDRESLIKIFSTCPIPIEVWAYGSREIGDAFEGSDLDLVLRKQDLQPLPFEHFMDLKDKIEDGTIPILIDLFDWPDSQPPSIKTSKPTTKSSSPHSP